MNALQNFASARRFPRTQAGLRLPKKVHSIDSWWLRTTKVITRVRIRDEDPGGNAL